VQSYRLEINEKRCLTLLLRRLKSKRSPYIEIELLKAIPNYKRVIKSLHSKGLVYYYKARRTVGLTEEGYYVALALMKEGY